MSKDITRRISIFINDKEVENSLKGVEGAISQTRNSLRKLQIGSEDYDARSKELKLTMDQLRQKQADYREELGFTQRELNNTAESSIGLRSSLSGIFDALLSGDLQSAKAGILELKEGMGGLLKSSLAFIASPIGLAIAALAGLAAGTKAMFDFNVEADKGARLIENLSGKTGQAVEDIRIQIQAMTDTFGVSFDELAGAVDNLVDTGVAKDELEALEKIKNGLLTAPDKNEFINSLGDTAVTAKQVGLNLEEVISLKKAIEETGVNPEATFGALEKAGRNLALQTDVLRKSLTDAFGASFTDEILAKVKNGEISTTQALDQINKKSKEVSLNQTQQAEIGVQLFGKQAQAAGGLAVVLDTVSSAYENQTQALNGNQTALEELNEANVKLQIGMSALFRVSNFGELFDSLKAKVISYFGTWLIHLTSMKNAVFTFGNIAKNTFINITNGALTMFQVVLQKVSPALKLLGVDVDALQKKIEGFKSKNVKLEFDTISNEPTKNPEKSVTKLTGEELAKQKALRDDARQKEKDAGQKAIDAKLLADEKAAKIEFDRAKALADAKADVAKATLEKFIFEKRANLDKEKELTPEIIAAETARLQAIKNQQTLFNKDELDRKILDLEKKAVLEKTSQETLNLQKDAVNIEYENSKQLLELGFQQSTDALKKQYEEEQKVLKAEQLLLDNELALAEADTKFEADKIKQEQDYQAQLSRFKTLLDGKKITEEEYNRFIAVSKKQQDDLNREREIAQVSNTLGELGKVADATTAIFGQNQASATASALINGGLAVTQILAEKSELPTVATGIFKGIRIAAAAITTAKSIGEIGKAKAPKRPQFFYGGNTGSAASLGYDEYGPVTGYVHKNEYVIPEIMTASPRYANTIAWLENERKQKLRGYVDGGSTSSNIPAIVTQENNNEISSLLKAVLNRLDIPIQANVYFGHSEAKKIEELNSETNNSNQNGIVS